MKTLTGLISISIITVSILITACRSPEVLPTASFTVSSNIARIADTIYFNNNSESADIFEWDFGDGNFSTEENPSHIYTENGAYVIHLKASNTDGFDETSTNIQISLWTKRNHMPSQRWIHSNSVVDGKIYVIGGGKKYGRGALSTVEEYDPLTDTWTTKSEMPTPRQSLTTSVVNGKIYAIGGCESPLVTGYNGSESYTTVEEYNPGTDTWTTKAPMDTARLSLSSSAVDGKIYVLGGSVSFPYSNISSLIMYDPVADIWTMKGNLPRQIINSCTAVVNGKIYVIGGEPNVNGQRVDEYDPVTNNWTQKANMPSNRNDHSCCVMDEKIFVIGGESGEGDYLSTVEIYDPSSNTWTVTESINYPRCGLRSSMVDGKVYAIGGLNSSIITTNVIEVYYE